jgi:serine/threonine protein kinase
MVEGSADEGAPPGPLPATGVAWVQGFTPLPTGARVGELTIQSVLGAGEYGITYVTEHEKRVKRYVLKEYFPRRIAYRDGPMVRAQSANATAFTWGLDRFLAEARAVQRLRHPSIVSLHGVTEAGGTGYAGMAYEAGRDWSIWLHELRRLPTQDELDTVLGPLVQALELAHASDVIHQDLGPESIVVRDSGSPVLVDFGAFRVGLRRRLGVTDPPRHASMAPEQLESGGEHAGPWTDIYALAALTYLAVTGKSPPIASERSAGKDVVPVAEATTGRYRTDFLRAIDAGLMLRPAERPQSMTEWREQLLQTRTSRLTASRTAQPAAKAGSAAQSKPKEPEPFVATRPAEDQHATVLQREPTLPQTMARDASGIGAASTATPRRTAESSQVASTESYEQDGVPGEPDDQTETLMENAGFRSLFFAAAGLACGAVGGALASVLVASLVWPECYGDNCIRPILPAMSGVGALLGAWAGARYARNAAEKPRAY